MQYLAPHAFAEGLYDLTDLAKEIEPKYGKYYDQVNSSATADGKYRGIPYNIVGNAFVYRKDYFQQAGVAGPPQTWDDFLDMVKKLAAIGKPAGGRGRADRAARRLRGRCADERALLPPSRQHHLPRARHLLAGRRLHLGRHAAQ